MKGCTEAHENKRNILVVGDMNEMVGKGKRKVYYVNLELEE